MNKISIIVPVFNVKDYLDECIKSILCQTHKNIELIIIDDGSYDGSEEICDKYAELDNRIRVIHKNNEGVSKARNEGLKIASGDYFAFVDADDFIDEDYYKSLLALCEERNADICVSTNCYRNSGCKNDNFVINDYTREEAISELLKFRNKGNSSILFSIWDGIYRGELFRHLSFPDDIHHFEDYLMKVLVTNNAKKIVTTSQTYYHYRVREGSANHININDKVMSCLKVANRLVDKGLRLSREQFIDVQSFFVGQCYFRLILSEKSNRDIVNQLKKVIWQNKLGLIMCRSLSNTHKMVLLTYILAPMYNIHFFGNLLRNRVSKSFNN